MGLARRVGRVDLLGAEVLAQRLLQASRRGRRGSWRAGSRARGPAPAAAPRGAARGSAAGSAVYADTGTLRMSSAHRVAGDRGARVLAVTPVITPSLPLSEKSAAGVEPHDLAVVLDLGAPGVGGAGDDVEAAPEGEQHRPSRSSWSIGVRQERAVGRPVAHLDPRVLAGAAHARRGSAGSPWSRALVTSSETPSSAHSARSSRSMSANVADDPAACVLHAAGSRAQGQGGPVQRHERLRLANNDFRIKSVHSRPVYPPEAGSQTRSE